MKIWAKITTTFSGMHCWPAAPLGLHEHLRNLHRHLFHVTVWIEQQHDDRDVEFLSFKGWLGCYLAVNMPLDLGQQSCEMIAQSIIKAIHAEWGEERSVKVEVSEDGENGAVVEDV